MLTPIERVLFVLAVLISLTLTAFAARRIVRTIGRGQGRPELDQLGRRLWEALAKFITFSPTFRVRRWTVSSAPRYWGSFHLHVIGVSEAMPLCSWRGGAAMIRLARISSIGVDRHGVPIVRRFSSGVGLQFDTTLLHPKARSGIRRDSTIVAGFIVLHVGGRFVGQSFLLALEGPDRWQPFASALASAWAGWTEPALVAAVHVCFWFALGLILAFLPYFLYSKHLHLFFAPINFLLKPRRLSIGALDRLNFDDPSIEQFGAARLEHLSWTGLVDAYACIMCNRCQDACPAYATGKVLSPAALEINKRYFLNQEGGRLAAGGASSQTLLEFAITPEAVWACTACGACIDVCPVGNEPMRDILEIRRHLVLTESAFPEQLQAAFRGMERAANPWNIGSEKRLEWAVGLDVPLVSQAPTPTLGGLVGRDTETAALWRGSRRRVRLPSSGRRSAAAGSARRSGNEYLFHGWPANVETLNRVAPAIVTTPTACIH
jgi:ferredoxin